MDNKLVLLTYCSDNVTDLAREAEERGLPIEVLVTEERVLDIIKEHNANYVVGVCCLEKVKAVTPHLDKEEIVHRVVLITDEDECFKKNGIKRKVDKGDYLQALDWLCDQ